MVPPARLVMLPVPTVIARGPVTVPELSSVTVAAPNVASIAKEPAPVAEIVPKLVMSRLGPAIPEEPPPCDEIVPALALTIVTGPCARIPFKPPARVVIVPALLTVLLLSRLRPLSVPVSVAPDSTLMVRPFSTPVP